MKGLVVHWCHCQSVAVFEWQFLDSIALLILNKFHTTSTIFHILSLESTKLLQVILLSSAVDIESSWMADWEGRL